VIDAPEIIDERAISDRIHLVRGQGVILDADLAELFGTETRKLNQQVRRNADRFGERFAFQLTAEEFADLRSRNVIASGGHGGRRSPPFAFTEHGIAMAATVTKTPSAVHAVKLIIDVFIAARRQMLSGAAAVVVDPVAAEQRRTIRQTLTGMAARIADAELNPRDRTTVRQEVEVLAVSALDSVKAHLGAKPIQNEKLLAEIRRDVAEAQKLEAEARKTHAEADRLDIDNMKERLALLRSIERTIEADDPAPVLAAMDAAAGATRQRLIEAKPEPGKKP
jgi:hypothetical protein